MNYLRRFLFLALIKLNQSIALFRCSVGDLFKGNPIGHQNTYKSLLLRILSILWFCQTKISYADRVTA